MQIENIINLNKRKLNYLAYLSIYMVLSFNTLIASNMCLDFDGVNDYIDFNQSVIPSSGDFTVSVWAKLDGSPASGVKEILSQNAGTGGANFYLGFVDGIIRAGDSWGWTGVAYPTDGEWHFYTVVKNSVNTFLYVDGKLKIAKGSAITNPKGYVFKIGN